MLSFSKYMYAFHENIKIKLIDAPFPSLQQQNPSLFHPANVSYTQGHCSWVFVH